MRHLLEVGKSTTLNVKLYQFFFQYKNATEIFIINTPGIMKKSKYQQYLYCFIVCMLVPYAFWFSYLRSATFRGAVHIRGGGAGAYFSLDTQRYSTYLRLATYKTKFSIPKTLFFISHKSFLF